MAETNHFCPHAVLYKSCDLFFHNRINILSLLGSNNVNSLSVIRFNILQNNIYKTFELIISQLLQVK